MPEISPAIAEYRQIFAKRSAEELYLLAQIKRFSEHLVGDPDFREALARNSSNLKAVTEAYGLSIDAELLRPLFSRAYGHYRFENGDQRWPLAQLWDGFIQDKLKHRDTLCGLADSKGINPRYDAWRRRQIQRCAGELGSHNSSIVHSLVSYELSRGCTVGCWFCGISADRFGGALPYNVDTERLWRGILQTMVKRFGNAAQSGFCYWATDPCDNPDYAEFIKAHYEETGMLPQTTTAIPLKNIALTKEVLALSQEVPCVTNRFSILTKSIMQRVHAEFSPMELLNVELVMQQKNALTAKSISGRALERVKSNQAKGKDEKISELPSQPSTIACVSGFLVNMLDKKVRLASPTCSSEQWPDGYRVYEEARFETVEDFADIIDGMVDRYMPEGLSDKDVLEFRPDLAISGTDRGFIAETKSLRRTYDNARFGRQLGVLIRSGKHTVGELIRELAGNGESVLEIHYELQTLFDSGLLNDDPVHGGINRHRASVCLNAI
jgi:radical SAM family RiPP maturation amino acid epimerase